MEQPQPRAARGYVSQDAQVFAAAANHLGRAQQQHQPLFFPLFLSAELLVRRVHPVCHASTPAADHPPMARYRCKLE